MIEFSVRSTQFEAALNVEPWERPLINVNHNLLIWQMEERILYFTG